MIYDVVEFVGVFFVMVLCVFNGMSVFEEKVVVVCEVVVKLNFMFNWIV